MCIRDRSEIEAAKAACGAMAEMCKDIGLPAHLSEVGAVSYTHLDVYKRQLFLKLAENGMGLCKLRLRETGKNSVYHKNPDKMIP